MKKLILLFYITLILIMIGACSKVGIFYSLENEVKVADKNNLNDKAAFENLIDTNPGAASGYYIGNAGMTVYYRNKVGSFSNWSSLTMPKTAGTKDFASDVTTSSMVLIGTELYVSRISHDGGSYVSGVFRLDYDLITTDPAGVVLSDWTEITSYEGVETAFMYYKLFTANGGLYINELNKFIEADDNNNQTTSSKVYYSGITPESTLIGAYTDISPNLDFAQDTYTTEEVIGMAYDGASHWLIYNNPHKNVKKGYAYIDSDPSFATATASTDSKNTTTMVSDIFFYDDTTTDYILISDVAGAIYTYNVTTPGWGSNITVSAAGIDCIFHGFADIDNLSTGKVIVGTTAYDSNVGEGYFQINMTTLAIDKDDQFASNYSSSDLSDSSIAGFLMDTNYNRLFAYTEDEGVWLNISSEWSLE